VPDPDCDAERVPHDDAEKESDAVPHALTDDDGDDIGEPDALSDQAFEFVTDEVNELDKVAEIVGEVEGVPETDGDTDCVPQVDAVKESDAVPHVLGDTVGDVVSAPDEDTVALLGPVTDEQ